MIKIEATKTLTPAGKAVRGRIYRMPGTDAYIMIARVVSTLSIEGDKYGCTIPFVNLFTGNFDLMDHETDLEYVGIITDEGE